MNDTAIEYLTTKELADLLRIKERKVYALAASGEIPCTRATGKLLFPRREIDAWLARASGEGLTKVQPVKKRAEVFLGSHDPLLEWALKQSGCHLASDFDGSMDGLKRFVNGEGLAAAMHVYESDNKGWNVNTVKQDAAGQDAVLIEFCWRERGLVIGPNTDHRVQSIDDLVGCVVTPRQASAGSQILLNQLLSQHHIDVDSIEFQDVAYTETEAVMSVIEGRADITLGLKSIASRFNLRFVPIIRERFDLLVDRRAWFDPAFQSFIKFCESPQFQERAKHFDGYDVIGLGTVHCNL